MIFSVDTVPSLRPQHAPCFYGTAICRIRILLASKLSRLRSRARSGAVVFLNDTICVKHGPFTSLAEASAMRYVSKETSIPVPRVRCAFRHHCKTYIVMERVRGEVQGSVWSHRTPTEQSEILSQLRFMLRDLRTLAPRSSAIISNVDGRPLFDCRVQGRLNTFGPFDSVAAFHDFLRVGACWNQDHFPEIKELITLQDRTCHSPPVFTHGDLSSSNILVQGNKIVAIVDWENAGWLPSYWEYTNAHAVNPQNCFWQKEIDKFLDPLPDELRMETLRKKWFGDMNSLNRDVSNHQGVTSWSLSRS